MAGSEQNGRKNAVYNEALNKNSNSCFKQRISAGRLFDENNCLSIDIADFRQTADDEAWVALLTEIERSFFAEKKRLKTKDGADLAAVLLDSALSDNWQVKAKALITAGRIGGADLSDKVIKMLKQEKLPCWQLQYLDCWWQLPVDSKKRAVVLAELTEWAEQPVTVRGLVWILKELATAEAAEIFVKFALNKKTMMVKDEFMTDAWYEIAEKIPSETVTALTEEYPAFKIWLNFRYPEEKTSHYSLYPSPDYLWQCAAEEGVDRKKFKKLYFKPRKKA